MDAGSCGRWLLRKCVELGGTDVVGFLMDGEKRIGRAAVWVLL